MKAQKQLLPFNCSGGKIRRKVLLQAGSAALIAVALWVIFDKPFLATIVALFSAILFVTSLWFPAIFERIDRFGQALGVLVSRVLTWLLLAPFFYIVCSFARLYLLLQRIDPLERAFPTAQASYWKDYTLEYSRDRFKRQF